jgi:hypothetical protein
MRTRNLSLNLQVPSVDFREIFQNILSSVRNVYYTSRNSTGKLLSPVLLLIKKATDFSSKLNAKRSSNVETPHLKKRSRLNYKKFLKPIAAVVVVVMVIYVAQSVFTSDDSSSTSGEIKIEDAKATQDIYKEFIFPLRDSEGEDISNINYVIEKVELRDEIIVKGKRATAIKGRTFLILILKIANEYAQAININTRDYVRLSVNSNYEEWLAPDIHNDPVEIQAISTKYTRLGFPINDTDRDLVLRVGEIEGEKEEITLSI